MKLLLSTDTIGGVWTYSIELARALEPHGVEVALACLGAPLSDVQNAETRLLRNVTVYEKPLALEWMNDPWSEVDATGDWLRDLAERISADVVQLCSYSHAALEWRAPVLLVAHSCVFSWWRAVHNSPPPDSWQEYHRRVSAGVHAADLVVAPSRGMLAALGEFYGEPRRAVVIPNARSATPFSPRTKLPVVLSVGRLWDEGKNIRVLAGAAAGLPWEVLVAGDATSPDGGTMQFDNVRPMGRLAEHTLGAWLGSTGIYALPALYEPFGLSVLEAALSRCPLVLGDIPTLRENWDGAALFVAPANEHAWHDALQQLIADGRLRSQLAQRAYQRAQDFHPQRQALGYLDVYSQLLGPQYPEQAPSAADEARTVNDLTIKSAARVQPVCA